MDFCPKQMKADSDAPSPDKPSLQRSWGKLSLREKGSEEQQGLAQASAEARAGTFTGALLSSREWERAAAPLGCRGGFPRAPWARFAGLHGKGTVLQAQKEHLLRLIPQV